jgi:hypothetical protein
MNAAEAATLVESVGSLADLDVLEQAELRHPKHDGGRVGVKKAIEARRSVLSAK